MNEIIGQNDHFRSHVVFSRPGDKDTAGFDYDSEGRVDADLVARLVQELDADFYLCGPKAFLTDITEGLEELGVSAERLHSETFGPAT